MSILVNKQSLRSNIRNSRRTKILINQSSSVTGKLTDLSDVDLSNYVLGDGDLLIYNKNEEKFFPGTLLEKQIINGGNF